MPDDARLNELLSTRASLMVSTAKMVAHYVAAAVQAGTPTERINAVLQDLTESTSIDEVFVSDADGNIEYGSHPDLNFKFPTDPESGTQAAAFAQLLEGTAAEDTATVVVQAPTPREFDGAVYQYVGVSGIVRARIVQVGIAGEP